MSSKANARTEIFISPLIEFISGSGGYLYLYTVAWGRTNYMWAVALCREDWFDRRDPCLSLTLV